MISVNNKQKLSIFVDSNLKRILMQVQYLKPNEFYLHCCFQLKKAEGVPEKNKSSIEELVVLKARLDAECAKRQEEFNEAIKSSREETDELQQKKEKLQNKLSGLKNKVDEARSKVSN